MIRRLAVPFLTAAALLGLSLAPASHVAPPATTHIEAAAPMASVTIFSIANTNTNPRTSPTVSYSGSGSALFTVLSNTWATDNQSIVVTFAIQQSFDGGTTWQDFCSTQWSPNQWGKGGPPRLPSMACTAQDVSGSRLLRAQLSASSSLKVGISAAVA